LMIFHPQVAVDALQAHFVDMQIMAERQRLNDWGPAAEDEQRRDGHHHYYHDYAVA
ncbi:MAG: hypothetical protein IIB43_08430, partial [Candidatus Marinimicrobia bacterium]|nr:hypothetical protein [Candidatus Neomarinimicrobiota bacterium]